jgi:hypothetical protein
MTNKFWTSVLGFVFCFTLLGCEDPVPGRTKPFGCDIFVRGTFFDEDADKSWEVTDDRNKMQFQGRTKYACDIYLQKGKFEFKIADASWHAINLGAWKPDFEILLDVPYGTKLSIDSGDFVLVVKKPKMYRFELFASNREKPMLLVSTDDE